MALNDPSRSFERPPGALTVAIVGRPNVGKSTLFNRLIGQKLALVDDTPGVTRDRREGAASLSNLKLNIVDTAGLADADAETLAGRMTQQSLAAIEAADLALFMIDAREGITPADRSLAARLRKIRTPLLLLANKCEGNAGLNGLFEAFELGLGEPVAISAEHGEGLADLYAALLPFMPGDMALDEQEATPRLPLRLAIVGRPNVGKSTLINQLLGEDRLLTGPEAGITRDAIAVPFRYGERNFNLVDTAGMRRHARVAGKLEKLSVADSLRAIRFAEGVILVIDGEVGLDKQDLGIAAMVLEEGRALTIAVNKWDTVDDKATTLRTIEDRLTASLAQARGVPLVTISALQRQRLEQLIETAIALDKRWNTRITTGAVNRWLGHALERHPPPLVSGRQVAIRYATQIKTRPPTVALFTPKPQQLPESYLRYLTNSFREAFDLTGVPVRLVLRKGKNPYAPKPGARVPRATPLKRKRK